MVIKKTIVLLLLLIFTSCINYYYVKKDTRGEPIIDLNLYSFDKKMSKENTKIIDTTSIYLEVSLENNSKEIKRKSNNNFIS